MEIFNDNQRNSSKKGGQTGLPGKQGPPGVGYKLTADGNSDINNKKLTKVAEGTENEDAITKHQLDTGLNTKINKASRKS